MKTRFFLFLLLPIFFGEFLHAQRRSDYRDFGDAPRFYFSRVVDTDASALYQTDCAIRFWSEIPDNCHSPLHIHIVSHDKGDDDWQNALRLYPGGIMRESYDFMGLLETQTRADYAEIDRRWDFRVILNRLSTCTWNTILKLDGYRIMTEGLFAGINALEQVEIDPEIVTFEKDLFSGCSNLKYVKFNSGSRITNIHQDVFWGCDALEVIEFDTDEHLRTENIKHMFTTKYYVNTHPNMKAFVVADGCVNRLRNTLNDVFKPVKDGTCRVMSRTEFYAPRVNGVTLNASSVTLSTNGATYQLTANVLPSNAWDRNVTWSSSNTSVVNVSSTGLITHVSMGTATITATSVENNGIKATCTVTAGPPADYVNLKTLSVTGHTITGDFNADSYSVTVPYSTSSVQIVATTNNYPGLSVTGTGNKTVSVGNTTFPVTVSAGSPWNRSRTYTITVHRKSNDASLKSLTAGGSTLPLNVFTHNFNVPHATGTFNITAAANHSLASISGTGIGNNALNVGDNTFTVISTAEDGNTLTHTINVHRKSSDASLKSLSAGGSALPVNVFTHDFTVPNAIDTYNITVEANHSRASLSGTGIGNNILNVGDNTFTVISTAEDGNTLTYTINVHRNSDDASLKYLTAGGNELPLDVFTHVFTVSHAVSTFDITAEANHSLASVSGIGNKTLNVGDNSFSVTVTPEEGNPVTRTINVYRKSNDASLKYLTAGGDELPVNIFTHKVTVPFTTGTYNIAAEKNHPLATISGTGIGDHTLEIGDNTFTFTVTSEEGAEITYTIIVHRLVSSDATLQSLTLTNASNGNDIPVEFDPNTLSYTVEVHYLVNTVIIDATKNHPKATLSGDTGRHPLSFDLNTFHITVTAENGHPETYTVQINRLQPHVEGITLNEPSLKLERDGSAKLEYIIEPVDQNIDRSVVWTSDNTYVASVSQNGTVTAKNAGTAVISVTTREGGYVDLCTVTVEANSDDALKSLSVKEASLSPDFHPDILDYEVHLENQPPVITIKAEATHFRARITGNTGTYKLTQGRSAKLTVSSEAGSVREYSITINYSVKNDTWHLKNDTLFIKGPSSIPAFYYSNPPWFEYNTFSRVLVIGSDIQHIGAHAFAGLTSLEKVINLNPEPQPVSAQVFSGLELKDIELEVPPGSESVYGLAPVWKEFGNVYTDVYTDIKQTGIQAVRVYTANGRLYVNSPAAERISIYSVTGTLLYGFDKPAGAFTSPFTVHPSSVLIVKGSSGWSKKIVVSG